MEEFASPEPRGEIIAGFNEVFTLLQRAQEARAAGNDKKADCLQNQGLVRLAATVESARPGPRGEIVAGYNEAFILFQRAQEARAAGNDEEASTLSNQGIVFFRKFLILTTLK